MSLPGYKAEIRRLLETARVNIADANKLIERVFDEESAEMINHRLYIASDRIADIKAMVKD